MTCTHPVVYTVGGVSACRVCGAVIPVVPPQEPPKAEPKRGEKTKAD